jgi:hypothetical protein
MQTTILADTQPKPGPDGPQPGWNDHQHGTNDSVPREGGAPRPACAANSAAGSSLPADSPPPGILQPVRGESDRAFEAFRAYWEFGPSRRFAAVGRKVGASVRTVRRWASDFNWKGRIKSCSAQCAQEQMETETEIQRGELQDAASRAQAFRERQYALAEAILDAAERYVANMEAEDMDAMSFADACKALEVASRLGQQAANKLADDPSGQARSLQDQLAALLDQAYGEVGGTTRPSASPSPASVPFAHPMAEGVRRTDEGLARVERVADGQVKTRGAC